MTILREADTSQESVAEPDMLYCGVFREHSFDERWRILKKQPAAWKPESREWLIGG